MSTLIGEKYSPAGIVILCPIVIVAYNPPKNKKFSNDIMLESALLSTSFTLEELSSKFNEL